MSVSYSDKKPDDVAAILASAKQEREQILERIKHIRPDNPYQLDFHPPGAPPAKPIGSAAKQKEQYLQQLEQLKDNTFKNLAEKAKSDPSTPTEKLTLAYDAVFYPEKDKENQPKERNAQSKDISTSQDHTAKILAGNKTGALTPTDLSTLFPDPSQPSIDHSAPNKTDREPILPGED